MNQRAFWKYYRDFNFFNLIFSVISGIYFGAVSGTLIFLSFGMFIGYLGYETFRKNEYYLYYNLGFTKRFLLKKVWICNLIFVTPLLIILFLFL
ncbi:hypothetical protein OQ279_01805 [Salinimicrobium sp. MT39]|uniref:Uncharacterized protein n=1 Tax=Salinimicrobium profundisediminis TaxID=2994553 RepID=A0A9X3I0F3_9FLAO|nr:hypothetical protein [Salinimicrobium profundisediminis]MCX2836872.1 hypothetical protein [Salinimicrobium profundisediminis]